MFLQFEDDAVLTYSNAPRRGVDVNLAADVCVAGFGKAIECLMDSSCGDGMKGDEVLFRATGPNQSPYHSPSLRRMSWSGVMRPAAMSR